MKADDGNRIGLRLGMGLLLLWSALSAPGESWEAALARMPLKEPVKLLTRTNCVDVMLDAFRPDPMVKALVFMPGSTDELYFFRRVKVAITNAEPSLLDVINALAGQTVIRATFQPPLLLLHTDEDTLQPLIEIEHQPTFERLQSAAYVSHVVYDDRGWDAIYPDLRKLHVGLYPPQKNYGSRHFFRPSMAGWHLSGMEAVRAISLASKTVVTVERKRLVFMPDERKEKPSRIDLLPPGTKPAIRELD